MSAAIVVTPSTDCFFQADRCAVDKYLEQYLAPGSQQNKGPVYQALRYAVLGAGQRIRPILALRVSRIFGAPEEATIRAAIAVELIHCASLILDDLPCMDNAAVRRGKPSVHLRFGEATAILAAFALVTRATGSVLESVPEGVTLPKMIRFQADLLHSLNCSGLIAGQAFDLMLGGSVPNGVVSAEFKTVPLFTLAISAGMLGTNIQIDQQDLLLRFGREFGLAFQMTDDYLDESFADMCLLENKLLELRYIVRRIGDKRQPLEEMVDYLAARVAKADTWAGA